MKNIIKLININNTKKSLKIDQEKLRNCPCPRNQGKRPSLDFSLVLILFNFDT